MRLGESSHPPTQVIFYIVLIFTSACCAYHLMLTHTLLHYSVIGCIKYDSMPKILTRFSTRFLQGKLFTNYYFLPEASG